MKVTDRIDKRLFNLMNTIEIKQLSIFRVPTQGRSPIGI